MRHKKLAAVLLAASLSATGVVSVVTAAPAHATGLIKCDRLVGGGEDNNDVAIKTERWDPIVNHNQVGAHHVHDFFGNRLVANTTDFNTANYAQMRAFGGGSGFDATSCRLSTDTASYWTPELKCIKTSAACDFVGQRITIRQFSAYYRGFAGQTTHGGSQALPADVRLVANDMTGFGLSGWTCGQNSEVRGGQNSIPDCSASGGGPGDSLTAHLNFPSCWNGNPPNHDDSEVGDTRDNADFRYPENKTSCPTSHPIEVVQLRETIAYNYTGNGTDVALSSDAVGGDGTTFHADFWNTWDQPAFVDFVQRCIRTSAESNCSP